LIGVVPEEHVATHLVWFTSNDNPATGSQIQDLPNLLGTLVMPLEHVLTHSPFIGSKEVPVGHWQSPVELVVIPVGHPQMGDLHTMGLFPFSH
jgi:hypothetical protein